MRANVVVGDVVGGAVQISPGGCGTSPGPSQGVDTAGVLSTPGHVGAGGRPCREKAR